ncbi:MAG TPA: tripartite tricarboxylate transporter permease [Geminicoccaceae bacterium]|nr:tripartite tricarboxylate transporter permease [Geminicoccus sp.]HMU51839.1 tripartite tricarboxylate transporter permease [Geminicoccaceae bacterium]
MESLQHLLLGLSVAATPANLFYCLLGCLLGTLVGVLPGIGPSATIAMLLPITFNLDATSAMIMLAGIYYGAQYGGSTTSILVNVPGQPESVVTAIDGHQMARQGRAGVALATAAIGSFVAGCIATVFVAFFAPLLAGLALSFGPAEFFSLVVFGLIASAAIAQGSMLRALAMILLGLMLGIVGTDVTSGTRRLTLGWLELADGLNVIAVLMGLFGLAEILRNLEDQHTAPVRIAKVTSLMPSRQDLRAMSAPILRGTMLGSILGILPGGGALLASFGAYVLEKRLARDRSRFGKGAIEGVAAPEAANNAGAQTSFIPMLTLGIPSNVIMAMMAGALIMQGIIPGPGVMSQQPALFWGLIVSMWIGNLMLVVLNLPLVGMWVKVVSIPYRLLYPAIMLFCAIGIYSMDNSIFDVYVMILFGGIGYLLHKLDCEPAPMLLGMLLGPMMEENLRRAMLLSRGDPMVFLERPISAGLLAAALLAVVIVAVPAIRRRRDEALQE